MLLGKSVMGVGVGISEQDDTSPGREFPQHAAAPDRSIAHVVAQPSETDFTLTLGHLAGRLRARPRNSHRSRRASRKQLHPNTKVSYRFSRCRPHRPGTHWKVPSRRCTRRPKIPGVTDWFDGTGIACGIPAATQRQPHCERARTRY